MLNGADEAARLALDGAGPAGRAPPPAGPGRPGSRSGITAIDMPLVVPAARRPPAAGIEAAAAAGSVGSDDRRAVAAEPGTTGSRAVAGDSGGVAGAGEGDPAGDPVLEAVAALVDPP
jgi:hypothetical protein